MINFLKKIRQTSIKENKANKYLMYAFGEVILVVVGILIALSVNNWNSERLEAKKLERFIHNLKLQLDKNLSNANYYIEDNTYYYKKSREFLSIIGSQEKAVY